MWKIVCLRNGMYIFAIDYRIFLYNLKQTLLCDVFAKKNKYRFVSRGLWDKACAKNTAFLSILKSQLERLKSQMHRIDRMAFKHATVKVN